MKSSDKKEIEGLIASELLTSESNPDFLFWLFKNFHISEKQSGINDPRDKSGTFYETKIICKNCRNELDVQIPVGVDVKEYQKKEKCEVCKCPLK